MVKIREKKLIPVRPTQKLQRSPCKNCGKDASIDSILGLCARSEAHSLFNCRLIKEADQIKDWTKLPRQAEFHGLAPLAYKHLKAVDALLPASIRREMQALLLRHRSASQVYASVLHSIIKAFQQESLDLLLLKGAALSHLAYEQPGMRPMKDLDLLVRPADAQRAVSLLLELGFTPSPPKFFKPEFAFHLPPMVRVMGGMRVNVEVHTNLFPDSVFFQKDLFERLYRSSQEFFIEGIPARTLGWEDMLWHVHGHAFGLPEQLNVDFYLMGVADLVSIVEKQHAAIDWNAVQRKYPRMYRALPALHHLTPWSDEVIDFMGYKVDRVPRGPIHEFRGWPLKTRRSLRQQGRLKFLQASFFPPEWWLRVHYGFRSFLGLLYHRWIFHPWMVMRWVVNRMVYKKGL